ncbi:cysteine desulfurase [Actinobacillus equuli]|nr:cysteine desulfurase [Actinobacillus equuli]
MLSDVSESTLSVADLPYRLEAGTPNIAGIIGFGTILEWLEQWDFEALNQAVESLAEEAYKRLKIIKISKFFSAGLFYYQLCISRDSSCRYCCNYDGT